MFKPKEYTKNIIMMMLSNNDAVKFLLFPPGAHWDGDTSHG